MPVTKDPSGSPTNQGPVTLPEEMNPTVYLTQFVEWLQMNKPGATTLRQVRLRIVWLHAKALDEDGIVTYGEIGADNSDTPIDLTLDLSMTPDLKKFLRGTVTTYQSNERWDEPALPGGLSTADHPFGPKKKGQLEITIWVGTGETNLRFSPKRIMWTILPKCVVASNLLYGAPSGKGAPIIKPIVLLSLSKQAIDVVK